MSDVNAIRFHTGATLALVLASVVTVGAFGWPFVFDPGGSAEASSHGTDAPWIFVLILPLLAAIVLAELNAGGIDAKAIALLGMLASVGGALRALSPGVAGLEPSFAVIMLGGRVFGRGSEQHRHSGAASDRAARAGASLRGATSTSTTLSTITPGWPTPNNCPTSAKRPPPRSGPALTRSSPKPGSRSRR